MVRVKKELVLGLSFIALLAGCSSDGHKCCSRSHGDHEHHAGHKDAGKQVIDIEDEITIPEEKAMETTTSGLAYEIIEQASADASSPEKGRVVTVHYTGWLQEDDKQGEKFDSSLDRGMPFSFVLGQGQVIKGWDEGVALMKVGEKRRLVIPSDLAYGDRGFPGAIPGGATLIFDVELLDVA